MKQIKKQYTIKGRLKRAKESYNSNFWNKSKIKLIISCVRSFLDTPRCTCEELNYCSIHESTHN